MAHISDKLHEIDQLNRLQQRDQWVNQLHPLVKLVLCLFYIVLVISVDKYQLQTILILAVYPVLSYQLADLSLLQAIDRMKLILPLVLAVGIFNPFFDRIPVAAVAGITITSGMISMLTLMLKGIYAVLSAYLLIATTSIEEICYGLQMIHVPKVILNVILLIYRYLFILGEEADRIMDAYQLRAPSQNGIHYKAWGSLVGQWLLRSMDKAQMVYESMMLRGFKGSFSAKRTYHRMGVGIAYLLFWGLVLLALRYLNVSELLGGLVF